MNRFEVLKGIEQVEIFADLIIGFVNKYETPNEVSKALQCEFTKEEMQTLQNAAQKGYPLSFSGMQ